MQLPPQKHQEYMVIQVEPLLFRLIVRQEILVLESIRVIAPAVRIGEAEDGGSHGGCCGAVFASAHGVSNSEDHPEEVSRVQGNNDSFSRSLAFCVHTSLVNISLHTLTN